MDWISVVDQEPPRKDGTVIVAIMQGRNEFGGDPVDDALIVILRCHCEQWMSMDVTQRFMTPDEIDEDYGCCWTRRIKFWKPWQDFGFPKEMLLDKDPRY
jgi:hypothetical protein